MIGLVDYDLQTSKSTSLLIPNIEIMKLSVYYKREEKQFCRLIDLNETELNAYDKIFFFSELNSNPVIPEPFLRANNVIFGGTSFTNGVYIPFENELIDYTLPKPTIYKDFLKEKYNEGIKTKIISHILDDSYYRNYAGKNKLPIPPILPKKRIFLYDKDFFYPDWEETIKILEERKCSSILRLHPIECKTVSQYFSMRKHIKINRSTEVILNFEIPLSEISYLIKKYKKYFLADITSNSNIFITLGETQKTNLLYAKDFSYKINLLYHFWAAGIPIKIKYIAPKIGSTNPFEKLEQFVEKWSVAKKSKTINEKVPKDKKYDCVREQYLKMIKLLPNTKELFNQSFEKLNQRGYWTHEY